MADDPPSSAISPRSEESDKAGTSANPVKNWMNKLRDDEESEGKDWNVGVNGKLFQEINELKQGYELKDPTIKEHARLNDTCFGKISKHRYFEATTMTVIVINALEIGALAEYQAQNFNEKPDNLYENHFVFIGLECFFCVYYTIEIIIRFFAYKQQYRCFCDLWFLFDLTLVVLMFLETFVLPFINVEGGLSGLSILRLLRLLRVTRMVKLMRAFPELMMIIKGLKAAVSAVFWTGALLMMITFTWGILFTNKYHQGKVEDDEVPEGSAMELFGTMGKSMWSLLIMGTILDDITYCCDAIRGSGDKFMLTMLILYIIINSFMMFNMLLGILVDVVGNTKEGETRRMNREALETAVDNIFRSFDKDENGVISQAEFMQMRHDEDLKTSLQDIDINEREFNLFAWLFFSEEMNAHQPEASRGLTKETFMRTIHRLQPGESMSALDFGAFREQLGRYHRTSRDIDRGVLRMCRVLSGEPPDKTGKQKVSVEMLSNMERAKTSDIIDAIQRRLGIASLEAGVPLNMMDEDLQQRVLNAEAFQRLGVPHSPSG